MVAMDFAGNAHGECKPSSEWRFHRDILQARAEAGAVIHAHSMFATTLACLRRDIPPFHYMIAVAGGDSIHCAPYALFGSQALSDSALQALQDRNACLLANHGMIVVGADLDKALALAVEVETLCEQYWRALQIGEPHRLTELEMAEVFEQFKGYGSWGKAE
jgi:L-fuculose-phosphate aldolase